MSPEQIEALKGRFSLLETRVSLRGEWELFVSEANLLALLTALHEEEELEFVHLADLSAYDQGSAPRFHVFYELISMERSERLRVVVPVDEGKMLIPTVSTLWSGATWLEREVFDMYGISFEGHKDMRRILLPPSFVGHPLRKDFVVNYRQEFEDSNEGEVFDPFGNNIVEGVEPT